MLNLRLYAYLAAALAIGGLLWMVNGWRNDSNKLEATEAELAQVLANVAERERLRTEQDGITIQKAKDYERQIADARKTNSDLTRKRDPIRVCRNTTSLSSATTTPAEPVTTPGEGLQPEAGDRIEAGPDIGNALYQLALEADECSIRLVSLQGWLKEQLSVK